MKPGDGVSNVVKHLWGTKKFKVGDEEKPWIFHKWLLERTRDAAETNPKEPHCMVNPTAKFFT